MGAREVRFGHPSIFLESVLCSHDIVFAAKAIGFRPAEICFIVQVSQLCPDDVDREFGGQDHSRNRQQIIQLDVQKQSLSLGAR